MRVDPIAQRVVESADPLEAYRAATEVSEVLVDALDWMPQGGRVYVAWAELTDLYNAGRVPSADVHAALREVATDWLDRPSPAGQAFVEGWLSRTHNAIGVLVDRYGDFWRAPARKYPDQ